MDFVYASAILIDRYICTDGSTIVCRDRVKASSLSNLISIYETWSIKNPSNYFLINYNTFLLKNVVKDLVTVRNIN